MLNIFIQMDLIPHPKCSFAVVFFCAPLWHLIIVIAYHFVPNVIWMKLLIAYRCTNKAFEDQGTVASIESENEYLHWSQVHHLASKLTMEDHPSSFHWQRPVVGMDYQPRFRSNYSNQLMIPIKTF